MKDLYKTYKEPTMTDHYEEYKERYMRELLEDVDKARSIVATVLDDNNVDPRVGLIALKTLVRQVAATMGNIDLKTSDQLVDVIWEDCLEPQMEEVQAKLQGVYH